MPLATLLIRLCTQLNQKSVPLTTQVISWVYCLGYDREALDNLQSQGCVCVTRPPHPL